MLNSLLTTLFKRTLLLLSSPPFPTPPPTPPHPSPLPLSSFFLLSDGDYKEIDRADINITNRLGIGEFGPIFDAEVKLDINDIRRAMIKVSTLL